MAQYNGYVVVPHNSYETWRSNTINNGYNVDGMYGNQCWDYCALLWWQYGRTLYTKPGGGGAAACWVVSRYQNARPPFIMVEGKTNIKRGDILVWNRNPYSSVGHIAFADEDYNGTNTIRTVGQIPSIYGINGTVHQHDESLTYFLGAFRNTDWDETPPSPTPTPIPKTEWADEEFPWPIAWEHWGW